MKSGQKSSGFRDIVRGSFWNLVSTSLFSLVSFLVALFVAKTSPPREFGLFALASVVFYISVILGGLEVSSAIVHTSRLSSVYLSSALLGTLCVSGAVALLLFALADGFASFFGEAKLFQITVFIGFFQIPYALSQVPLGVLMREVMFRKIAFADISGTVAGGFLGLYGAREGWGAWAMLAWLAGFFTARALMLWIFAFRLLSFSKPSAPQVARVLRFGGWISAGQAFVLAIRSIDVLFFGRVAGTWDLGIYGFAVRFGVFPFVFWAQVVGRALFPVMSLEKRRENARVVRVDSRTSYAFLSALFLGAHTLFFASYYLEDFLGKGWEGVGYILRIMTLAGFVQGIFEISLWILRAQGRVRTIFALGFCWAVSVALSLYLWGAVRDKLPLDYKATFPVFYLAGHVPALLGVSILLPSLFRNLSLLFLILLAFQEVFGGPAFAVSVVVWLAVFLIGLRFS